MELEVRHLRLVAAVAEHRSLTRAGDALHLTQSALSHQLRDIEDRLGARLFHRLNRRMVLTPAGERLLSSARSVLTELEHTESAIRGGVEATSVPLRIATECYTAYHWLPAVLKPFREKFPRVDVRIDVASTHNPLLPLAEGRLDLAIVTGPIRDRRLTTRALFDDEQVLIVAPGHPLASHSFVRLQDLRRERLLTYTSRDESHFVTRVLQPAGVLPASVEVVQLTEAMIEMVKAGLGVAVLARWAVAPHVRNGTLKAVRVTSSGYRKAWVAVMPKHLGTTDYVTEFVRLLTEHAPSRDVPTILPFQGPRSVRATG